MKKEYQFKSIDMTPKLNVYDDRNAMRKMYYGQITGKGRDPAIYEHRFQFDGINVQDALGEVIIPETFGYVLVCPHILVDFYWGDGDTEGNLRKKSYKTKPHEGPNRTLKLERLPDIREDDNSVMVGCLVELRDLHHFEANAWAESKTLEEYFEKRMKDMEPLTLVNPRKIEEYLNKR